MTKELAWLLLVGSGAADVAWAYTTKRSDGWSEPWWTVASLVFLAIFIAMLTQALRVLPLGTAYVVWTGMGAIGSLAVGALLLGETLCAAKALFAGLTLIGIMGLKINS